MNQEEIAKQAEVHAMAYRQSIIDRMDKQTAKGIEKYGGTIDKSGHLNSPVEAAEYGLEEATDLIIYMEHQKAQVVALMEQIRTMKAALRWYGNTINYGGVHSPVYNDKGFFAREVLKEVGE